MQRIGLETEPEKKSKPPQHPFRLKIYRVVNTNWFDFTIIALIVLNTAVIAMTYHRMSDSYEKFIEVMNLIFIVCYNIEFILKIIGLGKQYFTHDSWNLFDFFCIVGSDVSVIMSFFGQSGPIESIAVFFRAFRLIRLLRFVNTILDSSTMATIIYSAPQIQNILVLMSIILFMYAVLGINLFSTVMYKDSYTEQNNFRNFFNSVVLLLRCLTGEDWNGVMHDLAGDEPYDDRS